MYLKHIFSFFFSLLYLLMSILLFLFINLVAIVSPIFVGGLFYLLILATIGPGSADKIPIFGGIIGSFISLLGSLYSISTVFKTPILDKYVETSNPSLRKIVDEVSNKTGLSPFRKIYFTHEIEMATFYVSGGKNLILGVAALKYLTEGELKAIIAHECGHHHNGAMLFSRVHYRTIMFFQGYIESIKYNLLVSRKMEKIFGSFGDAVTMSLLFQSVQIFLVWCYISVLNFFLLDPEYEFYCDRVASENYGGNVLCSALEKMRDLSLADSFLREKYKKDENDSEYLDFLQKEYDIITYFNPPIRLEVGTRSSGTHPPLNTRVERAKKVGSTQLDNSLPIYEEDEANRLFSKALQHFNLKKSMLEDKKLNP